MSANTNDRPYLQPSDVAVGDVVRLNVSDDERARLLALEREPSVTAIDFFSWHAVRRMETGSYLVVRSHLIHAAGGGSGEVRRVQLLRIVDPSRPIEMPGDTGAEGPDQIEVCEVLGEGTGIDPHLVCVGQMKLFFHPEAPSAA